MRDLRRVAEDALVGHSRLVNQGFVLARVCLVGGLPGLGRIGVPVRQADLCRVQGGGF